MLILVENNTRFYCDKFYDTIHAIILVRNENISLTAVTSINVVSGHKAVYFLILPTFLDLLLGLLFDPKDGGDVTPKYRAFSEINSE
jgi:hypothetical protein